MLMWTSFKKKNWQDNKENCWNNVFQQAKGGWPKNGAQALQSQQKKYLGNYCTGKDTDKQVAWKFFLMACIF